MMSAFEKVRDALERTVAIVKPAGAGKLNAQCPAHDDQNPSLRVWTRDDGSVGVRCYAGCKPRDVSKALGLTMADLGPGQRKIVAEYGYVDENGTLLFTVVRYEPKAFRPRKADGTWNMQNVRRVLYHLPEVLKAVSDGRTVYVVEGEKDSDALVKAGEVATTAAFGAKAKWLDEYTEALTGAHVVVVADKDKDDLGRGRAVTVADSLAGKAASVRIVQAAEGKDAADHLAAGHTVAEFVPVEEQIFTDAHLADRAVTDVLHAHCWSRALGWQRWTGKRWTEASDASARELLRRWVVAEHRRAETVAKAANRTELERAEKIANDWRRACAEARINAVERLSRGKVEVDPLRFDNQPDMLNVGNGVVDLRTGVLRPHDRRLLFTKLTEVKYDPTATHPDWAKALQALPPAVADWMQIRIGQAATGHQPDDDVIPICQGSGKNGKSTIFTGVSKALGDFYTLVSDRVILGNPGDHPTELMDLRGARFALIEETPEESRFDMQRIKKITGTAQITARRIAKDSITFDVTHSLFVTSNHRPSITQTDYGTWRRLALVRFPYTFTGADCDPRLRGRIKRNVHVQQAVLAWIVAGVKRWYAHHETLPAMPEQVRIDTDDWRAQSDLILGYWQDRLVPDKDRHVLSTELFDDFTDWLRAHGQKEWSMRLFAERFSEHELVQGAGVVPQRIHARPGLSSRLPGYRPKTAENKYSAWLRVRFGQDQSASEPPQQPGQSSGQPGQGTSVGSMKKHPSSVDLPTRPVQPVRPWTDEDEAQADADWEQWKKEQHQ